MVLFGEVLGSIYYSFTTFSLNYATNTQEGEKESVQKEGPSRWDVVSSLASVLSPTPGILALMQPWHACGVPTHRPPTHLAENMHTHYFTL
jgi:hypothetical protein